MRCADSRLGRAGGFTLIEIMIVVTVIGLLASIAIPSFARARETSRATLMYSDMRTAASAFEVYAMENSDYPSNSAPGVIPAGMAPYLGKFRWDQPSPLGGTWNWDFDRYGFRAAVSVTGHQGTEATMLELDERVDDGNAAGGIFRARPNGHAYVLE